MKSEDLNKEDYTLKKIRHFQGTIDDYASYWKRRMEEGIADECEETKSLKKRNDDLNRDYDIYPVERD